MLGMPRSVLLIDDDAGFRALARRMVSAAGLHVIGEADTAATAIHAALELQPDLLLVDVGLPDLDGVVLARALVHLPWRPRVVLTSADRDAVHPDEVAGTGVNGFVPKDDLPGAGLALLLAQ
jgi:DNA-binding NarL/FixJ family response regulator